MSIISKIKSSSRRTQFSYCTVLAIIWFLVTYCPYQVTRICLWFFGSMIETWRYIGLPLITILLLYEYVIKKRSIRSTHFLYCILLAIISFLLAYCPHQITNYYLRFLTSMIVRLLHIGLPLVAILLFSVHVIKKCSKRTTLLLCCILLAIISFLLAYYSYRITNDYSWFFGFMLAISIFFGLPMVTIVLFSEHVIKKCSKNKLVKRQSCSNNSSSNNNSSNKHSFLHFATLVFVWMLSIASTFIMGLVSILGLFLSGFNNTNGTDSLIQLLIFLVAAIVCTVKSVIKGRQCIYLISFMYGIAPPLLLLIFLFTYTTYT